MKTTGLVLESQDYYNRSLWFEHVLDPKSKFFCPHKTTGEFVCPMLGELLDLFDDRYIEGDVWRYRCFVSHNTPHLIELSGGNESFVLELNAFFVTGRAWPSNFLSNPYYWSNDEYDLFSVWQFHYANRSNLTEKTFSLIT